MNASDQAAAEVYLAAFEALAVVLNAFVSLCSAGAFNLLENDNTLITMVDGDYWLQVSVPAFLHNINQLLTAGLLVRSRRAVLLSWKVLIFFLCDRAIAVYQLNYTCYKTFLPVAFCFWRAKDKF